MSEQTTSHKWRVFGHDWAVTHLRKSMAHGRIRHAYLIAGAESVGKETLARAFAMALNCAEPGLDARPCYECRACKLIMSGNHPDILYALADETTGRLKIEEVRRVASQLSLKPFEARHRIAVFRDFDRVQPVAQDALLKTLEEPPGYAVLLVLAKSAEALLATITSRSQILPLRPASIATVRDVLMTQYGADEDQATLLAHLSGGRIGWAIRALQTPEILDQRAALLNQLEASLEVTRIGRFELAETLAKDKLELLPVLELWQTYWRDVVLLCEGSRLPPSNYDRAPQLEALARQITPDDALTALQATVATLDNLSSQNINARLALEAMFLRYPGLSV